MNDMEEANQRIWGGKWKEPPIEQEFTEIKYCKDCGKNVAISVHFCHGILRMNSSSETVYQCSLCLEESETEECNCYEN